jgi:hypothetical protein
VIPLIIAGIGTGLSLWGGLKQSAALKRAGKLEEARQNFNADVYDLLATDAAGRGFEGASRQRAGTRGLIGTARAGYAGQNVDVNVGSAIDVQADAAFHGELDAQRILQDSEREAWGYRVQAYDRRLAGRVARETGQSQGNAAMFGAVGSTLTSAGSIAAQKWGW